MKIEVIDGSKIKVTLTVADLTYHNLKPERISSDSPDLKKFLFSVMENVRRETGFNPYKGTVAIEAIQSNEGIILYISNIGNAEVKLNKSVIINGKKMNVKVYGKKHIKTENRYSFDNFNDLCNAIKLLNDATLKESCLYEYGSKWYFVSGTNNSLEQSHCILTEHCSEFGSGIASKNFLSEHGKRIACGEKLISMANGLRDL